MLYGSSYLVSYLVMSIVSRPRFDHGTPEYVATVIFCSMPKRLSVVSGGT